MTGNKIINIGRRIHIWFFAFLILAGPVGALADEGDIPGSSDHPDLGRFGGSFISGYDSKEFDEYPFHAGPLAVNEENIKHLEGAVEQIAYTTPAGASVAEVYRNYKIKLEEAGYEILFECENKSCGGTKFAYALKVLPIPRMVLDPFQYRYLAAQSERDGQVSSIAIVVSPDTDNQGAYDYNKTLSRRRAESVVDALVNNYGIDSTRLKPDGVGYLAPVTTNDSEAGRALNRRVELVKAN